MTLIYGNVYSFNYIYLKPGFTKWKKSRIWWHKQDRLKGYYLMTTKIPNIDLDFYVFVSKESNENYYIYYVRIDNIIINPIIDDYDQEIDIIKNGFLCYYDGSKVQLKDPEILSNIELFAIKHYIKLNDCLDTLNAIDYQDNFNIVNHYLNFTPNGKIQNKKLELIYKSIKQIGYFISLSPPVKNKFSGGALYKRGLLDFNLIKNNLN